MNKEYLIETQKWVKEELERCVSFWLKNGMDEVNGGVYTCLDRTGKIYSTDKAYGCRVAAAGFLHTSARSTA